MTNAAKVILVVMLLVALACGENKVLNPHYTPIKFDLEMDSPNNYQIEFVTQDDSGVIFFDWGNTSFNNKVLIYRERKTETVDGVPTFFMTEHYFEIKMKVDTFQRRML